MEGWSFDYRLGGGILHVGGGKGGHYVMFHRCSDGQWIIRDDLHRYLVKDPLEFKENIVGLLYHRYVPHHHA